jgi:hypothetical protein
VTLRVTPIGEQAAGVTLYVTPIGELTTGMTLRFESNLDGQYRGVRTDDRPQRLDRGRGVVGLHGEEHHVDGIRRGL